MREEPKALLEEDMLIAQHGHDDGQALSWNIEHLS